MTRSLTLERAFRHILLIAGAFVIVSPLIFVFFGAFKTQGELTANPGALWPDNFGNLENFRILFREKDFGTYLLNSTIVSGITVLTNVLFGASAGYALAKLPLRGRATLFSSVIVGMIVPYTALFAPQFVVISQFGLINTFAGIILPVSVTPISVFIMRQTALSIPDDTFEAARVDGAGEMAIFFRNFLPLVGPALGTVAILSFLSSWNMFLWPLMVAQTQDHYTLSVGLSVASQHSNTTAYGLLLAGAIIVITPVLLLFFLLQKYFIQGVTFSGLK
jgi:multiple sugar transport system permease protein